MESVATSTPRHQFSAIVWRRCRCGHAAPASQLGPGHGINTNIGLTAIPTPAPRCLHDGCECVGYDGHVDDFGVLAEA